MLLASDLVNDGMSLELYDITVQPEVMVLYAFWSDVDHQFTFQALREELPFELVETFVLTARERLPPQTDAS